MPIVSLLNEKTMADDLTEMVGCGTDATVADRPLNFGWSESGRDSRPVTGWYVIYCSLDPPS